jgi:hypothetical protein
MNVAKNMEFVFVAAVVVAVSVANAFAAPAAPLEVAAKPAVTTTWTNPTMTIHIVGKRPTRAQKLKRIA